MIQRRNTVAGLKLLTTVAASLLLTGSISAAPRVFAADNLRPPWRLDFNVEPVQVPEKQTKATFRTNYLSGATKNTPEIEMVNTAATPLSSERTEAILRKLAPLPPERDENFALPQSSPVRPKISVTANEHEPEPQQPVTTGNPLPEINSQKNPAKESSAQLKVTHISHSGSVAEIKELAITFSRPMVQLERCTTADVTNIITLNPQPTGEWQWAGTQTLLFKPKSGRFPQATNYIATISDTVKSLDGTKIEKSISWNIQTPAAKVTKFYPEPLTDGPQCTTPRMLAYFNQAIDPKRVINSISMEAGARSYDLQLLEDAELKSLPFKNLKLPLEKRTWVAFKPTSPLPKGRTATVTIAHPPSAEGPLTGSGDEEFLIKIYGPLRLTDNKVLGRAVSKYQDWNFHNQDNASFAFSNEIDADSFNENLVTVTPPVDKLKIKTSGNRIEFSGLFLPVRPYKVTFSKGIKDKFGQTLETECTGTIRTGVLPPSISQASEFESFTPGQPLIHKLWAQGAPTLRVTVRRVAPEDWAAFNLKHREKLTEPLGMQLACKDFAVGPNGREIKLDLSQYLKTKYGHLLIESELIGIKKAPNQVSHCWIQVTDLALDVFGRKRLTVLASRLNDATPLEGIDLTLAGTSVKVRSDKNGLATIELPFGKTLFFPLIAKNGPDSCIVTAPNHRFLEKGRARSLDWYVISDRNLYRPGEKACIKGWLRSLESRKDFPGSCQLALPPDVSVSYSLLDESRNTILTGDTKVDKHGGFAVELALPKTLQLGTAYVSIKPTSSKIDPDEVNHPVCYLKIQEFRRPEIEMTVTSSHGDSLLLGENTTLSTKANYLAGGAPSRSPTTYTFNYAPTNYTPPGWPTFQFYNSHKGAWYAYLCAVDERRRTVKTETDSTGSSSVELKLNGMAYPTPMSVQSEVTVTDLNRQPWSKKIDLLVHPADLYLGVKKGVLKKGEPLNFDIIATNIKGEILPGTNIDLDLTELDSSGAIIKTSHQTITIKDKPETISYQPSANTFSIDLEARAKDQNKRMNLFSDSIAQIDENSAQLRRNNQMLGQKSCLIKADKTVYKPGEVAEIKIESPIYPARGLFMTQIGENIEASPLKLDGPETTIKIPISEDYYPSTVVQVYLAKDRDNFAIGQTILSVPPISKTLSVSAKPRDKVAAPGQITTIDIELKDQNEPVAGGQVSLAVVDDSVLALSNYKLLNPVDTFYRRWLLPIEARHSRTMDTGTYFYIYNARLLEGRLGESGDPGSNSPSKPETLPALLRQNFVPLALFKPDIETDSDGKAQVRFKLPDSITRYRIMAVAAAGSNKFGATESSLTTHLPLAIRPSPPRFLNCGDRCELSVMLHNQTDRQLQVDVAMRADNAVIEEPGKTVTIPPKDRIEVRFATTAGKLGQAHFQCKAVASSFSDAAEFSLPILFPADAETTATYATIDSNATTTGVLQKISLPQNIFQNSGGLTLSTSSSATQSLTGAYSYLCSYPYECSEQISSRLIAMLSLKDSLIALGQLKGDEKERFDQIIQNDLDLLEKRMNGSGGFGLWSSTESQSWPFVSIQATQAINLAAAKGYRVNPHNIKAAIAYLRKIEEHIPTEFDEKTKLAIAARALNVRHFAKDDSSQEAKALFARLKMSEDNASSNISVETAAWLLPVLNKDKSCAAEAEKVRKLINSLIIETASTASAEETGYAKWNYCLFFSQNRSNAALLEALIDDQPQNPLILKLVRGLQQCSKNGVWLSTQENSSILQALSKYFSTYEKPNPDFKTQAWLNETLIVDEKFNERSAEAKTITVPMKYLTSHHCDKVQIDKTGAGRLYYRLALDYTPNALFQTALDRGFVVSRTYEAVDDANDVKLDEHGVWHFKAGARVRARISFQTPGSKYHVAMVAPLPAGAEAINSQLLGVRTMTPTASESDENIHDQVNDRDQTEGIKIPCTYNWYEHENLRDRQVEAFCPQLHAGSYGYTYMMQASTPGRFTVSPTKVVEMYSPETFGRSKQETIIVE